MNRLKGMRSYLAGPMDRVADGGVLWRRRMTPILNQLGVIVMDPCIKPYDGAVESDQGRENRRHLKQQGYLAEVAAIMKEIRCMDLKMVDASDFLICYINTDVHMCGSYEEITLANRQKKPVLCWVEQGRNHTPDWLLGMLPTEMFFSTELELIDYLKWVDKSEKTPKRWYTPHFHMLYDKNVLKSGV